jgi:tripartite-type tricarboxylate transporter receptor subunit TctC
MALFNAQAGTSMTHVPYKGIMQAASGVAGGEVQTALIAVASLKGLADAGRLKFIGVASSQRLSSFPNIPTIAETGLPGFEFTAWFAFLAPKGTPQSILKKLNIETLKALSDPEVKAQLIKLGLEPIGSSQDELAKKVRDQLATYGAVIKKAAIKSD